MPKVKDSFFTSRLIVFNETFAAMKKNKEDRHYCMIWHEAIAGRRAEDIASVFIKFIQTQRDTNELIIWMDNCTSQNKNWVFYSALLIYINSSCCTISSIILKYLLTGHTYMAADGLHGKIEQHVKKMGNVEDFDDFKEACRKSALRNEVISLNISDFMKFQNICRNSSVKKKTAEDALPFLRDIVEIKFIKGEQDFFYKTNFTEDNYKKTFNVLKRKTELKLPESISTLRGIPPKKKDDILKSLVPAMKPSRKPFWENLPTNELAPDLLEAEGF